MATQNILNIRLSDDVLDLLKMRAAQEDRPVRTMAALLIKRALTTENTREIHRSPANYTAAERAERLPRPREGWDE